ncbi:MAG: hypothetical protein Q4D30_11340 [Bacteroidales bacterium]|nr:hypothetical protein [Bacteroidales bacterium]
MIVLLDILRYSFGSIIWGILIALSCMALFVFLIKGWYKDATFSPISYVVGVILFLLLSFQCILIVGSLKIIDSTDSYETQIRQIVEYRYAPSDEISLQEADDIIKEIIERFPILHYYISGGTFSGHTARQLPHSIASEIRSFMSWYIVRRILWCLGFVVVGAFCVIKTMSSHYKGQRRVVTTQSERRRTSRRIRR